MAGKPSVKSRRLIQVTHDSLMMGIEAVRPGATFDDPHQAAVRVLTQGLLDLGLLSGSLDEALVALENDHQYLLEGGVFTEELVRTWIDDKRTMELQPMALRPHPYEFELYYGI